MLPQPAPNEADLYDQRERGRVVAAARALYLRQGIEEVSLADVARYLRMPEHAVRRWFPSSEPLVAAVVEAHATAVQTELRSLAERFTTAVEEMLALRNWVSTELRASRGPFFQQLEAHYPAARQYWQAHITSFPREHLRTNLHRGMQQGLYLPSLDVEQEIAAWFEQLGALHGAGPDVADVHYALFSEFLARLVTPAGALVTRRLQEAAPYY